MHMHDTHTFIYVNLHRTHILQTYIPIQQPSPYPQALPVLLGNILDKNFAVKRRNDINEVADGRFQHVVRARREEACKHPFEQVILGDVAMVERCGLFDLDAREKEAHTRCQIDADKRITMVSQQRRVVRHNRL